MSKKKKHARVLRATRKDKFECRPNSAGQRLGLGAKCREGDNVSWIDTKPVCNNCKVNKIGKNNYGSRR